MRGGACIAHEDGRSKVLVFLNVAEGIDEEVVCKGGDVQVEFSGEARSGVTEVGEVEGMDWEGGGDSIGKGGGAVLWSSGGGGREHECKGYSKKEEVPTKPSIEGHCYDACDTETCQ